MRQSSNHIVGLVTANGDNRYAEGFEQLADPLERAVEVVLKLLIQLLAGRLVVREPLVPEGRPGIVDPGKVVWPVLFPQAEQEVDDPPGCRFVRAVGCPQRTRNQRLEGAID